MDNEKTTPQEINEAEAAQADDTTKKAAKKKKPKKNQGGFKAFLKSKKARHGSLAIAIVVVVTALVIVLNVIVGLLVERFPNLKLDFTANSSYALNKDTEDYMSHLKKDVTLYILSTEKQFTDKGEYFVQANNLVEKMAAGSNGKLTVKYVDITSNPNFTKKYSENIDWNSSKVVAIAECGSQYKALLLEDCFDYDEQTYSYYGYLDISATTIEQAVVTATLNVTTENKVIVDFLTGNQEMDYSALSTLLSRNAYQVNEINLVTQDIDKDAKFLVLFAPSVDLDENAVEKISDWLKNNGEYGKSFVYVPSVDGADTPNIDALLEEWKLKVGKGYVFETSSEYLLNGATPYAFITDYNDYYTENLKNSRIPVVTYQSHNLEITDENAAHALLKTSNKAGIRPVDADEDWDYNEAITGEPIAIAAESTQASADDGETSSVIVFGSYTMFSEDFMSMNSFNNSAFFMNIVNTISDKDDDEITIESKSLDSNELGVTDQNTSNTVFVIFVVIVPLIVIITGIVVWIRRRNK